MYRAASFSVCILLSLSEGNVGMILRKAANASFRDCVLCRSRTFAMTRCDWRSSKDWGLLLLDFLPLFPGVGLSESSPFFLLGLLFLPHLFGCRSSSPSLLLRLSTGETGALPDSSPAFSSDISTWVDGGQKMSPPKKLLPSHEVSPPVGLFGLEETGVSIDGFLGGQLFSET